MIRACVLGLPVAHSLSPYLHGHWLKKNNIAGEYTAIETPAGKLADTLNRLADQGYAGCNLTLPLKEATLPLMDVCDETTLAAGAVNTVVFRAGKRIGYNSDGYGFMESLWQQHKEWRKDHVVILGAGGAARAIAAALLKAGVARFTIINRTRRTAEKMIADLKLPAEVGSMVPENASLLVNATSLGMAGQPPLGVDISALLPGAAVCDIVYRPLETPLLAAARARGLATIEGLPMLLHQGRLGFKLWYGVDPVVTPELYGEIAACAK